MKTILLYIFLFIAFFATGIAQAKTYQIPVLTVRSSDNKGNFSRYEFKLEKTSDVKPAIIMVGDDTPGGAGAMQKSSIWLAASTAALQRNTSLKGVEITVKFSGHIDGPSAGAIICLAIMSALDDRDMPDDFAITGTIMPDGTIGHVGGVEKKILAAKEAGIKRICIPAGKRWYKDPKTNEEYDYKKIAEDNCLEFHEVDNIVQAYNIMHKLNGENQPYISERSISQLPPEIEKKVEEFYNQEVKSWHEIMRANVMGKSKSEIEKDPIFQTMAYGKSNKLRNKGRLLLAIREMRIPLAASKAYGDFAREIARIRARYTEYKKNKNSKINYLLDLISTAKHIFKKEYFKRNFLKGRF